MWFKNWDMSWDMLWDMSKPKRMENEMKKAQDVILEDDVKDIPGLQTECRATMEPNAITISILKKMEEKGCCAFEMDDSPESYQALLQLSEISGDVGYTLIGYREISGEAMVINSTEVADEIFNIHCYIIFNRDDVK